MLKEPPGLEELKKLAEINNITVKDLINKKSQIFKKLAPDIDNMDEEAIADLIRENPRILVRPIITKPDILIMGFKEKQYQESLL